MKQLTLFALLWFGLNATAQQKPETKKSADNTKEARAKKQEAQQEVQKGRAEKKQKMEEAKRNVKEKVARDTSKTSTAAK
ncbi:hypothetical protein [Flavobacterium silvaticum]|uniref:Uncharacterized protein n=1 Tax=Flavobacterium silvaticum TaxID=1852020 RepID=A0A972FKD0_9FLAO|nr:hypothetical protein [Flavobacterium silvaticum]NMH27363.1 hypothetical protein [Flavobacterium silvaticum]